MAKRKEERVHEVFAWLLESFPLRRPCRLTIRKTDDEHQGWVLDGKDGVEITLDCRLPRYVMLDCLLHEYAHVKSRRINHGLEFMRWDHKIIEAFWVWRASREKGTR